MNEVEMVFSFDIVKDILSSDIGFFEKGVESDFMMVEFAGIDN
jgi:hypothetical protein